MSDETFVQLHGMGGRTDLLPGLIYSALEHDLCTCSEAAITVILDALGKHAEAGTAEGSETQPLSAEKRRAFDRLRAKFEAGAQIPEALDCKLLKLADSFESPPATEWADMKVGGCVEQFRILSKLNDQQEIVQIRGGAMEWYCQVAEQAGSILPPWIPDRPILFDDLQRGLLEPRLVMNRDSCERWLGFVFTTIKQRAPEALPVTWGTPKGPLSYGFATFDRDLCAASVLAIDLARLTTAAAEAANRERAICSPFSVPSLEKPGLQWEENTLAPASPPENYTLGQLIEDLRRFGEYYHLTEAQISEENPFIAKSSRIRLAVRVSGDRARLLAIPGFTELREWVRSEWNEEVSFAVAQRIVDTLVQRSNGSLSADDAQSLTLVEAAARLRPAQDENEVPARIDRAGHQAAETSADGALSQQNIPMQTPAPQPAAESLPDGPFDGDGFRYHGKEVRFGRAAKQQALVLALWNTRKSRPRRKRKIEDVLTEVYGHDQDTADATFRQLCSDTQRRLDAANIALKITSLQGMVYLESRPL
jgi:hypothetical protein